MVEWVNFKEKVPEIGDLVEVQYKTVLGASPTKKKIWSAKDELDLPYSPLLDKWRLLNDETRKS